MSNPNHRGFGTLFILLLVLLSPAFGAPGIAQVEAQVRPIPRPRPPIEPQEPPEIPAPAPQLPGEPLPQVGRSFKLGWSAQLTASITAGQTYTESIPVSCDFGPATADMTVSVAPPGVPATLSPTRINTPGNTTLTFPTTNTTPSATYVVTITANRVSGPCSTASTTRTIEVVRPVRLEVTPTQQTVRAGTTSPPYTVLVRRSPTFTGRVDLRTSGLPVDFAPTFNPNPATGANSALTINVPANTNQCLAPNGCDFMIRGSTQAGAQVDPVPARIIVQREVALQARPLSVRVKTGETARFTIDIQRFGFPGLVGLTAEFTGPPPTPPVIMAQPNTPTPGNMFTLDVTTNMTPGSYKIKLTPVLDPPMPDVKLTPVTVEIIAELPFSVSIQASPLFQAVAPSVPAFLDLVIATMNVRDVEFAGISGLPSATTAVPNQQVNPTRVTIVTSPLTPPGDYPLVVMGLFIDPMGLRKFAASNPVVLRVLGAPEPQRVELSVQGNATGDLLPGGSASFQIVATRRGGYSGRINLAVNPATPPGGVIASFNPPSLTGSQTTATLTLQASPSAPAGGPFNLQVTATTDPQVEVVPTAVQYRVVTAPVPMIRLSANPAALTILSNQSASTTITATRTNCSAPITLVRPAILPPEIRDVTFTSAGTDRFDARFTAGSVSEPRMVTLFITGQAPGCANVQFQPAQVSIAVQPAGGNTIRLLVNPTLQTVNAGAVATSTVQLDRGGVTAPVQLAVTGLPPGATASFSPNPVSGASATLSVATAANTPAGTYTLNVAGTASGATVTPATATLVVSSQANQPTITSFTPSSGTAGTNVQIFGTNFVNVLNVAFNGINAAFAPITANQVNATVPGFATTGPIQVTTAVGTATSTTAFVVGSSPRMPVITGFSPPAGPAGTPVTILGVNLDGATAVTFGGTPANFARPTAASQIDTAVPAGARDGFIQVTTPNGTATSTTAFDVTTPDLPEIGGFNPLSGPAGTNVEIIGANLGTTQAVAFNGTPASFTINGPGRLFATVPSGATTGKITATTPAGTATSFNTFAVTSGGPVITDLQPRSGQVGFAVTIAGVNLNGATSVTFNGRAAQFTVISGNFIQAFVPAGATTGPVVVTTPNGSAPSPFAFQVQ